VFWCTADVGWITGHSYIVYGPMANGLTSVMYEGTPDYPDKDAWWEAVEKYRVSIFYTAPTAIRACMKWGEEYPGKHDLSSLRTPLYDDPDRYVETYFSRFGPRTYFAGDGARRDEDGYFWITGRIDDVINVSGHRLSTAEIEAALVAHAGVAEAGRP
jgi:acyl-coenzyme A synthetase/AMP-(fatty) acid ligase